MEPFDRLRWLIAERWRQWNAEQSPHKRKAKEGKPVDVGSMPTDPTEKQVSGFRSQTSGNEVIR
jgi:hypothetical protein